MSDIPCNRRAGDPRAGEGGSPPVGVRTPPASAGRRKADSKSASRSSDNVHYGKYIVFPIACEIG